MMNNPFILYVMNNDEKNLVDEETYEGYVETTEEMHLMQGKKYHASNSR
jgi:hypothetical protein